MDVVREDCEGVLNPIRDEITEVNGGPDDTGTFVDVTYSVDTIYDPDEVFCFTKGDESDVFTISVEGPSVDAGKREVVSVETGNIFGKGGGNTDPITEVNIRGDGREVSQDSRDLDKGGKVSGVKVVKIVVELSVVFVYSDVETRIIDPNDCPGIDDTCHHVPIESVYE